MRRFSEATLASRAVSRSAESIDRVCNKLFDTLIKVDTQLDNVESLSGATMSVFESAVTEAGRAWKILLATA